MVLVLTFEGLPVRADQPEISKIRHGASSIDPASDDQNFLKDQCYYMLEGTVLWLLLVLILLDLLL